MPTDHGASEFKLRLTARAVSDHELLDDLRRVAEHLGSSVVPQRDYIRLGQFSCKPYRNRFGSWNAAVAQAGLSTTRETAVSDAMLFDNLEAIWLGLGRQPFYSEICKPLSKYSMKLYLNRFGGWTRACEVFLEYKSADVEFERFRRAGAPPSTSRSRTINEKTRLRIFKRDNYACVLCGRSPATSVGLSLHIDHILPFSKGGDSSLENLRTLCDRCNLGRGNDESV